MISNGVKLFIEGDRKIKLGEKSEWEKKVGSEKKINYFSSKTKECVHATWKFKFVILWEWWREEREQCKTKQFWWGKKITLQYKVEFQRTESEKKVHSMGYLKLCDTSFFEKEWEKKLNSFFACH